MAEVWLVDRHEREILVSRRDGPRDEPARDRLIWSPPELSQSLTLDLREVFAGLE